MLVWSSKIFLILTEYTFPKNECPITLVFEPQASNFINEDVVTGKKSTINTHKTQELETKNPALLHNRSQSGVLPMVNILYH